MAKEGVEVYKEFETDIIHQAGKTEHGIRTTLRDGMKTL